MARDLIARMGRWACEVVAGVLAERGGQDDYSIFLALTDLQELNTWITGQRPNPARDGYVQAASRTFSPAKIRTS